MKVYFVVKEPSERTINHFVSSLGNALQKQGCEVVYGLNLLWTDEVLDCDIIHFQWPEGLFGLFGHQVADEELKRVNQRLVWLKEHGKKLFYTCHNLKPHTNKNENLLRLYELIYSNAEYVQHLGDYSCELLQSQYPNVRHVVIPHHIYDNVLSFSVTQQEARQRLHLPQDKKIILSFGKFRDNEERQFVLSIKNKCNHSPLFGRGAGGEATLQTAGAPARLRLTPDRTVMTADGQSLTFVTVEVLDKQGTPVPEAAIPCEATVKGAGKLLAFASADLKDTEPYTSPCVKTWKGRALLVVRSTQKGGSVNVTIKSSLPTASLKLKSK
jgi:hypothetical protein